MIVGEVVARGHTTGEDADHVPEVVLLVPVDLLALPFGVAAVLVVHRYSRWSVGGIAPRVG